MSSPPSTETTARQREDARARLESLADRLTVRFQDDGDGPPASARLKRAELLGPYTTFRIVGPADLYFEATSADELAEAVILAREIDVPYFVLGLGANILVGDKGFRGLVIRNTSRHFEFRDLGDHCLVWTESGAVMKDLILEAVRRGWSGLEHYVGIPSTVGGAIWQNLHFLSPASYQQTMGITRSPFVVTRPMDCSGEWKELTSQTRITLRMLVRQAEASPYSAPS